MDVLADDVVFFDTESLDDGAIERLSITAQQLGARVTQDAAEATITLGNPLSPHYDAVAGHAGYHWLAHCKYEGARVDAGALEAPLFVNPERASANAPLLAYVSLNVQRSAREDANGARAAVEEQLARGGALILPSFSTAELVILDRKTEFFRKVDTAKKKHGRDWQRLGERSWVESCVAGRAVHWATAHEVDADEEEARREREREEERRREEQRRRQREDSFAEDDVAQHKRGPGRPAGKPRNEYTPQEDDFLCRWLAAFHPGGGYMSRKTYETLVGEAREFPLAARHSSQSWRERYKKNEQPFKKRIDRFIRKRIDARLEDDDDRLHRAERPESTKARAALVDDEDDVPAQSKGTKGKEVPRGPAIGRTAREAAAAPKVAVVASSSAVVVASGSSPAAAKSAPVALAAARKSVADAAPKAKAAAPPVSDTENSEDEAPVVATKDKSAVAKKDKGKGVDRSPVNTASTAQPTKRPATKPSSTKPSSEASAQRREKEKSSDGAAFFASLARDDETETVAVEKTKAAAQAAAPRPSTGAGESSTLAPPPPPAPAPERHDFDETMASAILGRDDDDETQADKPSSAQPPAPTTAASTQPPAPTQPESSSTTAPRSPQPVPPGQQRRSSPPPTSSPHGTSQEDESQDSVQAAVNAEYAKRKAEAPASKAVAETKPKAEAKRDGLSTPPRSKRMRLTEPVLSPASRLPASPSIHVTVSPGHSRRPAGRQSMPADSSGRVRIPVTFDLDIDVRTSTAVNAAPAATTSSKRLLEVVRETQDSDAPVKRRRTPVQTESQAAKVRAGAKVVGDMRDMYKERILKYSAQYGKPARELYDVVNGIRARKGGDRGGAMFWKDVEQGLKERFGAERGAAQNST
ncbi:hypothetical protein Q8F55_001662 [Vanrija albida]|uniref:Rap1 Myb domain-containing protein n=1 Tax=Vanrija albida TaxID=181172 RepID=A0ABR3Q7V5_9TREE